MRNINVRIKRLNPELNFTNFKIDSQPPIVFFAKPSVSQQYTSLYFKIIVSSVRSSSVYPGLKRRGHFFTFSDISFMLQRRHCYVGQYPMDMFIILWFCVISGHCGRERISENSGDDIIAYCVLL